MKRPVYAVRDLRAGRFGDPFASINDAVATRHFSEQCCSVSPRVRSDFELFRLGDLDDESGVMTVLPVPAHVADGAAVED